MKLPSSIKVGWKKYEVIDWHPDDAARAQRYGECDFTAAKIRVDTSRGARQSSETLWHECLHAAVQVGGVDFEEDKMNEELVVRFMASWTMTILGDNPELREFLNAALGQTD